MTERANVTLPGKVEKIIESPLPSEPEKAQISVDKADDLRLIVQRLSVTEGSPRILVVDDSAVIRRSLRSLIAETDWEICGEAENGKVGVEMAQTLSPDVVILDLAMPVMNGLEAARCIRETMPNVGIVLFTVHDAPQLSADARKAGVNEMVAKLADPSRLLSVIHSLLDPNSPLSARAS
jgi:two-component system, NarL family, response regulator NreC